MNKEQWIATVPEQLRTLTYGEAEDRYRSGCISQDDWETYCRAWRNSAVRFSHLAAGYDVWKKGSEK